MKVNTEILEKVIKLKKSYDDGRIPTLEIHEVHPDLAKSDRLNYIYFTFPVALNFQRSSPAMWQSALKTYSDPETNYLFYPEKVVLTEREKVMADLTKHKLGLQRNKHTDIWMTLSKTLVEHFEADPKMIIKKSENCVTRIKNLVQKDMKKAFPYLSGPKITNYWLYILTKYTDVKLRNMQKISIIPDTHVFQASKELGLIESIDTTPEKIETIWFELLKNAPITPVEMHPVLWNWSRNNFKPAP